MANTVNRKMPYAVKIAIAIKEKVKKFCDERGVKQSYFVETALLEKLEREKSIEDIVDLKLLRREEVLSIPFEKYLAKR